MIHHKIEFADCNPSQAVTESIKNRLEKIEKFFDRITDCSVTIRIPNKDHGNKKLHIYHVLIHLDVPGARIVVNRDPDMDYAHTDINIAIRDAFNKLTRQLKAYSQHFKENRHMRPMVKYAV